jgi:hypothetical protein
MAVILTVTATASCWKEHTCYGCGCVFRYLFKQTAKASGRPGEDVKGNAEQKLARKLLEEIESCPCPTCGAVQPDMVDNTKVSLHRTLTILAVAICFLVMLPTFPGALPLDIAGQLLAAVAGFTGLCHLLTALSNPNRNRARNRTRVQARIVAGTVVVVRPGEQPPPVALPYHLTPVHALALLVLLAAPPAFLAVVYVSDEHPLPRNAGLKPDVIGPGDEVTIPIDTGLRSYGGHWRGTSAKVQVVNAADLGTTATLPAATDTKHWGKILTVSDGKHPMELIKPWVRVTIPEDAALGGKTIDLRVTLAVSYPTQGGTKNHTEQSGTVEKEVHIVLADADAGVLYKSAWDIGKWVGVGACLIGGLILVLLGERLKRRAHPHQALPIGVPHDGRVITGVGGYGPEALLRGWGR